MKRRFGVLFGITLVLTFGAAACGAGLTQEQSEVLERQGEMQDQLLQQQEQQQEQIERLEQDVAQLKRQLQGEAPTPQDGKKRQGGGEKEETLEK